MSLLLWRPHRVCLSTETGTLGPGAPQVPDACLPSLGAGERPWSISGGTCSLMDAGMLASGCGGTELTDGSVAGLFTVTWPLTVEVARVTHIALGWAGLVKRVHVPFVTCVNLSLVEICEFPPMERGKASR